MNQPDILLSNKAHTYIKGARPDALKRLSNSVVLIETATKEQLEHINIALITRDVTGQSTKHVLTESLQQFYAALRAAPRLKWVHTHSAGLDRPIFGELQSSGVTVTASTGANAEVVAHTALAGVLSLARRFPEFMKAQSAHQWTPLIETNLPRDLRGQTAVIVGWGPIGRQLGRLLQAVGLEIIVARNSPEPVPEAKAAVTYDHIKSVLPQADWLILACPLSSRTSRLIDAEAFSLMRNDAHLINVARGEVVDQEDLISALMKKQIAGAFLDVFDKEPLDSSSPLWDLDNVIVTPHSAGHADGNYGRVIDIFMEKLSAWPTGSRAPR